MIQLYSLINLIKIHIRIYIYLERFDMEYVSHVCVFKMYMYEIM